MTISSINYNSYAIPAQPSDNCEDCKEYEKADSNDDGLLTANEIGEPSSLSINNAIPQESIETQELQEDIASAFDALQHGKINQEQYNELLRQTGIETYQNDGSQLGSFQQPNELNQNNDLSNQEQPQIDISNPNSQEELNKQVQEDLQEENFQKESQKQNDIQEEFQVSQERIQEDQARLEFSSALYQATTNSNNVNSSNELRLSSYASMMDIINRQTQPASISEKLNAYTQNLRY